jgi:hypothetical protein
MAKQKTLNDFGLRIEGQTTIEDWILYTSQLPPCLGES